VVQAAGASLQGARGTAEARGERVAEVSAAVREVRKRQRQERQSISSTDAQQHETGHEAERGRNPSWIAV